MLGWVPFAVLMVLRYHFHDSIPPWSWGFAIASLLLDWNDFRIKIVRVEE
jgi:hypothetical protein